MASRLATRLAATPFGVWAIRHVVAPLDRVLFRLTRGRYVSTGRPLAPMVLLTVAGRTTGRRRTFPVFALRHGAGWVVCNVRPRGERGNPWPLNLDAAKRAEVDPGTGARGCTARRATPSEVEELWPKLVAMWPTYAVHFADTGERAIFVLTEDCG